MIPILLSFLSRQFRAQVYRQVSQLLKRKKLARDAQLSQAVSLAFDSRDNLYAAYNGIPILFTQRSGLPDITVRTMNDLKVEKTVVVGRDSVVPVSVYQQLPGAVRYGGSDRYETAAMIAQELKLNLNTVYVATGKGFADALVAGNLASHTLSPLILVDHGVPDAAAGFFSANRDSIHNLVMVGGEGIINQAQEGQIRKTVEK
ncbi:Cell wall binding repeat 2-containing protein [Desulfitobacterium hafniense]|uniref:Cell wall binding repeat 2-containing protein n=1 Tax=Desulfitobacterium hafniense TaxID=49338 RepID=A0A098B3X7_DESHA|nr:Cell wall binding repeat 2-containing protein [Desulfitobacterium hafniense]